MSTPQHPHRLRLEQAKGAGGEYVAARYSQMRCDGAMGLCGLVPARGLMIIVPPKPWTPELAPRRVFSTLHYCERHIKTEAEKVTVVDQLSDHLKHLIEQRCKAKWPHEYKPDFDRAFIRWELVTTPEYRKFLVTLEEQGRLLSTQGIPLL